MYEPYRQTGHVTVPSAWGNEYQGLSEYNSEVQLYWCVSGQARLTVWGPAWLAGLRVQQGDTGRLPGEHWQVGLLERGRPQAQDKTADKELTIESAGYYKNTTADNSLMRPMNVMYNFSILQLPRDSQCLVRSLLTEPAHVQDVLFSTHSFKLTAK